ncbi:MAG: hypothetical protein U0795_03705 [Pirellulales bacterium]
MTCVHLQELYKLCQQYELKLGAADLVRVVCHQCGEQEVCPSTLMDEYDSRQRPTDEPEDSPPKS